MRAVPSSLTTHRTLNSHKRKSATQKHTYKHAGIDHMLLMHVIEYIFNIHYVCAVVLTASAAMRRK